MLVVKRKYDHESSALDRQDLSRRNPVRPIRSLDPLTKGLPTNIDAEKFILGSVLLDDSRFIEIAGILTNDDFAIEKHRRIFIRMSELHERGEKIDRVTLANELLRYNELESVDGLSYLVSLDDGLPHISNLDSYVKIVREKANLRQIIFVAQHAINRALACENTPSEIARGLSDRVAQIDGQTGRGAAIDELPGVGDAQPEMEFIRNPELPASAVIALTGNSGSGKSTLATAWARDVIADGRPALILDRESPRPVALDRMRRIGLSDGSLLRWAGGWLDNVPDLATAGVTEWVRRCTPAPLIIVDSLVAFIDGDENDASEMRRFMHQARRLADVGATVIVIHHDGKSDSARDFRGSSDFKAAVDQAFHVSNVGDGMRLDRIRLRCFKSRYGLTGDLVYLYAGGQLIRDQSRVAPERTAADVLRKLLRLNPGIPIAEFEKRAVAEGIARSKARDFVKDGVLEGSIDRETLPNNKQRLVWIGGEIE